MAKEIHTLHIDRHRAVPLLFADRLKFAGWNNAGIVKKDVDASEFLHRGAEDIFHMISLAHVSNRCKTFTASLPYLSGYLVHELAVDVDRHNFCSFLREQRGRRSANSRGRAGYNRRLILEIHL